MTIVNLANKLQVNENNEYDLEKIIFYTS